MSQPGRIASAACAYGKDGMDERVRLRVSSIGKERPKALLLPAAGLASRRIYLSKLHELVVLGLAGARDHGAHMLDVLGLRTAIVAALAERADKPEALTSAGEAADERSRTLVLAAPHLYAYCVLHG